MNNPYANGLIENDLDSLMEYLVGVRAIRGRRAGDPPMRARALTTPRALSKAEAITIATKAIELVRAQDAAIDALREQRDALLPRIDRALAALAEIEVRNNETIASLVEARIAPAVDTIRRRLSGLFRAARAYGMLDVDVLEGEGLDDGVFEMVEEATWADGPLVSFGDDATPNGAASAEVA